MNNSWIKLHRSLVDSAVFKDAEILKVWIWILCKVTYRTKTEIEKKQVVEVQPGQMIVTSRKEAAEELNITENKYRKAIDLLEQLGCIAKKSTNKFTLISVVKWGFFQGAEDEFHQQTTNKPPTNHQQTTSLYNKKNYKNINKYNNYNNARTHARDKNCVPTPKSTKFNNFTPSGDIDYAELEKKAFEKQLERIRADEQIPQ